MSLIKHSYKTLLKKRTATCFYKWEEWWCGDAIYHIRLFGRNPSLGYLLGD